MTSPTPLLTRQEREGEGGVGKVNGVLFLLSADEVGAEHQQQ